MNQHKRFVCYSRENPNNMFNRQYVETVDGKWYDITAGYKLVDGERSSNPAKSNVLHRF